MDNYHVVGDAELAPDVPPDTSDDERIKNLLHPVGTIIESTTCNTMAKVVEAYGGTTWIQHSGYVLRGATSGVVANSATKTGGSDDAVVVSHAHTASSSASSSASTSVSVAGAGIAHGNYNLAIPWVAWLGQSGCANGLDKYVIASDGNNKAIQLADGAGHAHGASASTSVSTSVSTTVNANGESGTNKNMMNYKSVYIWERTA